MSGIALHTHARTVQRNGPTTAVCIKAKSCPDIKQRDRDSASLEDGSEQLNSAGIVSD